MAIERIVIVDESDPSILFFEMLLSEMGFKDVKVGRGGPDAINVMKANHSQLAIVSWEMASMPGTVFIQRARDELKKRHLPYLIYSKRLSEQDALLVKEVGLANVLTMPLDKTKAKAELQKILDFENNLSREEVRLRKIESYLEEGKPTEALKLVDASLKKKGEHYVRAHIAIGLIWSQTGQPAKAEESLKAALAEDENNVDALNALASLYAKQGRHQEGIDLLQRLSAQSPKNLSTLLNLGSAYVDADRIGDAKQVFDKVKSLDPDSARLKDEQAKVAFKEGDLPLAAKLLAETRNGDSMARYFNNLAIALTHRSEFDRAIETYENSIKLLADKAKLSALRYNLGLAYAKKGDLKKAFLELVISYKADPTFEKAYVALARVAKTMGEKNIAYDKQLAKEVNVIRKQLAASKAAQTATTEKKTA